MSTLGSRTRWKCSEGGRERGGVGRGEGQDHTQAAPGAPASEDGQVAWSRQSHLLSQLLWWTEQPRLAHTCRAVARAPQCA
jgi:hypothetical protein